MSRLASRLRALFKPSPTAAGPHPVPEAGASVPVPSGAEEQGERRPLESLRAVGLAPDLARLCEEFAAISERDHSAEELRSLLESLARRFGEPVAILGDGPSVRWHVGDWCLDVSAADRPGMTVRPWDGAMRDEEEDFEDQAQLLFPYYWVHDLSGTGLGSAVGQVIEDEGLELFEAMQRTVMWAPNTLARLPERWRPRELAVRFGGEGDDLVLSGTVEGVRVRGTDAAGVVDDVLLDADWLDNDRFGKMAWLVAACAAEPDDDLEKIQWDQVAAGEAPEDDEEADDGDEDVEEAEEADDGNEDVEEEDDDEEEDRGEQAQRPVQLIGATHGLSGQFDPAEEWTRPFTFAELRHRMATDEPTAPYERTPREETWSDFEPGLSAEQLTGIVAELLADDQAEVLRRHAAVEPTRTGSRESVALGADGWPVGEHSWKTTRIDLLPPKSGPAHLRGDQLRAEVDRIGIELGKRMEFLVRGVLVGPGETFKLALTHGDRRVVIAAKPADLVWRMPESLTLEVGPARDGLGPDFWR